MFASYLILAALILVIGGIVYLTRSQPRVTNDHTSPEPSRDFQRGEQAELTPELGTNQYGRCKLPGAKPGSHPVTKPWGRENY